jgi:hypothetical protein
MPKGQTDIPEALTTAALAVPRVNRPEQVARLVFDVIEHHHAPQHRARVEGLARVDLCIEEPAFHARLILATPLYVQDASSHEIARWAVRLRMHRRIWVRHGRSILRWRPHLPPEDRNRYYDPDFL